MKTLTEEAPYTKFVLAYTTAGLGHLRVTNALFEAAPAQIKPVLLRSQDTYTVTMHRITSIHPWARRFMEWTQKGTAEMVLSYVYSKLAHLSSKQLFEELSTLVEEDFNVTKKLVIVCTHFGLAHEISGVKEKLARKLNCEVKLVVVVTDASPQKIWVVSKADLTIVPSLNVGAKLAMYAELRGWKFNFEVVSYPLNPKIVKSLSETEYKNRLLQLDPASQTKTHVLIPISGAAVTLPYYKKLIELLIKRDKRFYFYVVSKDDMYTRPFLKSLETNKDISLVRSTSSREIVRFYNELLEKFIFSLEVVKPSEQSFKALIPTNASGGVLLLFTRPVGRQEYDNLNFLKEHELIPERALELTGNEELDAEIILNKLKSGEFLSMAKRGKHMRNNKNIELSVNGSSDFWKRIKTI